jgi:alkylated DNA repair dioxygenase AlkB
MPSAAANAHDLHLDGEQGVLLDLTSPPRLRDLPALVERVELGDGAWVDLARGWVEGADSVFSVLLDEIDWRHERRQMYHRVVDVPRLVRFLHAVDELPHPLMREAGAALTRHYADELPIGFATAGLCLYRSGADSVAWHGDYFVREQVAEDTLVAIVSLGAPRALALRPRGGGSSVRFTLDSGDLLVMGGSCQRTWEHAVPKSRRPLGPRISVQFRPPGLR